MQPTRTEAIKRFLLASTHSDLADLYNHSMECQVNVGQDGGTRVTNEFKGRQWHGFTDGVTTWKSFRIPRNANTEPEYEDTPMNYDLVEHAEGIGMTGWDWENKVSRWFGFDFDAIVGHSERHAAKLIDSELKAVEEAACAIPWVTVRRSTSGKGLHLYVFTKPIRTVNHNEHAALARATLGMMSGLTGFDFQAKVDAAGGNMWVWHRKMRGTDGLTLIKKGGLLEEPPLNWREHVHVVTGKRRKILPEFIEKSEIADAERIFEELTGQRSNTPLDNEHKQLLTWLKDNGYPVCWDADHHMLITHTFGLAQAHEDLRLKGVFKTLALGSEQGDHNCFSGEETILTAYGNMTFRQAAQYGHVPLWVRTDKGFDWLDCAVQSFGVQKTMSLTLDDGHTLRATPDHRWLTLDPTTGETDYSKHIITSRLVTSNLLPNIYKGFTQIRDIHTALIREEVFCAIVPGWENFTLGNGILTKNCFAFPLRRGAWAIRRYTPGVSEASTWDQDGAGWTRTYYNREPDLPTAAKSNDGNEHPSSGFHFRHAEQAIKACLMLGTDVKLAPYMMARTAKLKEHKDGKLIVEVGHEATDNPNDMPGWIQEGKVWKRVYNVQVSSPVGLETGSYDDMVRHVVTEAGDDYGWVIHSDNQWRTEPLAHVKFALDSFGLGSKDVKAVMGGSVFKPWTLVNRPFQPEYPGDRSWNRGAAQFRFHPSTNKDNLNYPTWTKILNHLGHGLNEAVQANGWAQANGITCGADYLKCWIASLFQEPDQPLPYLFLYSPEQSTGKSILHEGLKLLVTHGVERADTALISQSGFNGELENVILCVVEETDLQRHKGAYNRIKDWVTSRTLPIHKKGRTPYSVPNMTHWLHCANTHQACPVFSGDTRITMIRVEPIDPSDLIPKKALIPLLEKEASDFMAELLSLEIPPSNDRLNVPVIETEEKRQAEKINKTYLEMFLDENCHYVEGEMVLVGEFFDRFREWLDPSAVNEWSKIKIGREMPPHYCKGRRPQNGQFAYGNMSWTPRDPNAPIKPKLVLRNDMLVPLPNPKEAQA